MQRSWSETQRQTGWGISVAVALVAALLYGLAAPAHATIVERGSWVDEGEFVIDDACDFDILGQFRWEGRFHIREGKANDTATPFFLHERVSFSEVLSANGTHITISGHETVQEIKATYVGDAVFEFTVVFAGNTTVRDASGKPIVRNSGNVLVTYLFDKSEHPREPGGTFLELIDVQVNGPKLWDEMSDEAFCALFE